MKHVFSSIGTPTSSSQPTRNAAKHRGLRSRCRALRLGVLRRAPDPARLPRRRLVDRRRVSARHARRAGRVRGRRAGRGRGASVV